MSLLAVIMAVGSCGGNADVGGHCSTASDCADGLQCFDHTCLPRCTRHTDCGDGHICGDGACELVETSLGDLCVSEVQCGPGQACHLEVEDFDEDGLLPGKCQAEVAGGVLDASCLADGDCRTGTCVLGRCVDLCPPEDPDDATLNDLDCPLSHTCTTIPRELANEEVSAFYGCLPSSGNIVYPVPFDAEYERFFLPVPGSAQSVALVASIEDASQLVGAARVESPSGDELLYQLPLNRDEYFNNRLRHEPTPGASTLLIPQSPDDPLIAGAYVVELGSYLDLLTPGTEIPTVDIIYKLGAPAIRLDVHFYFLELDDHPCAAAFDDGTLDAARAQSSDQFQDQFLDKLNVIFSTAGVLFDHENASYTNIGNRPDLDGLDAARLGDLLSLSDEDGGISIFFVRTLSPVGLQGLVGGPPSPPGRAGTRASGVAISVDTLCYRSWDELARITAHEIARSLGLHRNLEPDEHTDPIVDDDVDDPIGPDNLMYYSEFGGELLSDEQKSILTLSPALR